MNYTTFDTLTVRQYQQLYAIHSSEDKDLDKIIQSVCVLADKTERQVEEMSLPDFNKVAGELSVIFGKEVKGNPKSFINIAGDRYGIVYDPSTLSAGQYIEIQTWMASNVIENLNKIMASIVYRVTGRGIFKKRHKYDAANHPAISEAILDCNFIDVHSTCVFFLKLWNASIVSLEGYLAKELRTKGVTRDQLRTILARSSVGFSTFADLPKIKE